MVITREKGEQGEVEKGKGMEMVMEGDLTWGGEHTVQYTDDILQNCTLETYIILLTSIVPVIQIQKYIKYFKNKKNKIR